MAPATTFTWTPAYTYEMEPEFRTDVTEFENGSEERVARIATPIRRWRLVFRAITKTQFDAMKAFFIARKGRFDSFNWTCKHDSIAYIVRFEDDAISFAESDKGLYDVNCTLRTCTE